MSVRAEDGRTTTRATVSLGSAARELGWQRRELEFAVQLGAVRSVGLGEPAPWGRLDASGSLPPAVPGASWQRRVLRAEIDRLAADPSARQMLRGRLRLVGTAEAAELLGISPGRFTRLARGGCVSPARFSVNRYRAVVWWYLAAELHEFAASEPGLGAPRAPERLRAMMRADVDWRGRNWRARRVGQLLAHSADPWSRAAVSAAVLSAEALAETVPAPAERAFLRELDPPLSPVRAVAPAVCAVVDTAVTADGRDEVIWHQIGLATALDDARVALRGSPQAAAVRQARDATSAARALPEPPTGPADPAQPHHAGSCREATPLGRRRGVSQLPPPGRRAVPPGTPAGRPGTAWEWLAHVAAARRARERGSLRRPAAPGKRGAVSAHERRPARLTHDDGGADLSPRWPGGAGGTTPPA
ncbi:DUF6397 family protein [Streptomyces sp. NPDC057702]|uniref:DUF6397 family protein n=1 Tax=unclassified Streptomyces TaxID=2593676 RepID=UPI0036AB6C10